MKGRSAVIFPDTVPSEQILFPLVQVFQPLVYFQAVENDQIPAELDSPVCETFRRKSLCRIEAPAPLGPDRDRFLRLVSDLQNRRDDYAAQLGHVALAGISSASRGKPESKSSIVSKLLSSKGIKENAADRRSQLLWQARLLLKLGEIYDADQERLNRDLQKISKKEADLIAELRREDGSPFSMTSRMSAVSPGDAATQQLRLKAWSRLYALGTTGQDEARIFLSRNSDAVGRLVEEYEKMTGAPPLLLGAIPLPGHCRSSGPPDVLASRFHEQAAGLLAGVFEILDDVAGMRRATGDLTGEGEGWEQLLESIFPRKECGRTRLTLYGCHAVPAKHLFIRAFGADEMVDLPSGTASERGLVLGALDGS